MNRRRRKAALAGLVATCGIALAGTANTAQAAYVYDPTDFAVEVIASSGFPTVAGVHDQPVAILGQPSTQFYNTFPAGFHRTKLIEAPYNTDLSGEPLIANITTGRSVTVKMGRTVYDDPANPFGIDLIVYGNHYFTAAGGGFASDDTNLNTAALLGIYGSAVQISISPDNVDWYTYPVDESPLSSNYLPTNAYLWDRDAASWSDELADPTKPVDPSVTVSSLLGKSAADALDFYDGSAGGLGLDLASSGFDFINYVRFDGIAGGGGQAIDAVAAVRAVPEPASIGLLLLGGWSLLRRSRQS